MEYYGDSSVSKRYEAQILEELDISKQNLSLIKLENNQAIIIIDNDEEVTSILHGPIKMDSEEAKKILKDKAESSKVYKLVISSRFIEPLVDFFELKLFDIEYEIPLEFKVDYKIELSIVDLKKFIKYLFKNDYFNTVHIHENFNKLVRKILIRSLIKYIKDHELTLLNVQAHIAKMMNDFNIEDLKDFEKAGMLGRIFIIGFKYKNTEELKGLLSIIESRLSMKLLNYTYDDDSLIEFLAFAKNDKGGQ